MDIHSNNALKAGEDLKAFSFVGPRGHCYFHATTHHSLSPLFEVELVDDGKGYCSVHINEVVTAPELPFEALVTQPLGNAVSGWYNSYACL